MSESFCKMAFDHEPGTTCLECGLVVDRYGNTEQDFLKCCFPDCGCDGERLCMAGKANADAVKCNVEGMYRKLTPKNLKARGDVMGLDFERERKAKHEHHRLPTPER